MSHLITSRICTAIVIAIILAYVATTGDVAYATVAILLCALLALGTRWDQRRMKRLWIKDEELLPFENVLLCARALGIRPRLMPPPLWIRTVKLCASFSFIGRILAFV